MSQLTARKDGAKKGYVANAKYALRNDVILFLYVDVTRPFRNPHTIRVAIMLNKHIFMQRQHLTRQPDHHLPTMTTNQPHRLCFIRTNFIPSHRIDANLYM